jgi:hypothetical protein
MPKIFVGGQLYIDARRLEDDADVAAQSSGLANSVESGDGGAAGRGNHERGKDPEQRRLAAAIRAEQSEQFGRPDLERNAIQGGAVLVAMDEIANGNYGPAVGLGSCSGRSEVDGG